jgi:DNA-binding response OmpR family regulator
MAKVVIVENDRDIAPLVEKLLELEGYTPLVVADPMMAAETIWREKPVVVYLDVRLTPDVDGFAILKAVRNKSDVPVLMCSGLNIEQKCLNAGANAFLLKPFDFHDLLDGIKRATSNKGVKKT